MAWGSDNPELRGLLVAVEDWFADLPIRGQVLELGCGTGAWTRRLVVRAGHDLGFCAWVPERTSR